MLTPWRLRRHYFAITPFHAFSPITPLLLLIVIIVDIAVATRGGMPMPLSVGQLPAMPLFAASPPPFSWPTPPLPPDAFSLAMLLREVCLMSRGGGQPLYATIFDYGGGCQPLLLSRADRLCRC